MAKKGGKNKNKGEIKSKKKDGNHPMDQLKFKSRTQEKVYDKLAIEFVERHLPKIMDIVPKEIREKRGDVPNPPGKIYKPVLKSIDTKETYVTRAKTFIKWQVTNQGIKTLGEIDREKTDSFFKVIENNIGQAKNQYSTKTYDSYVDGTYKLFEAMSKRPEEAKVKIEGREFAKPVTNAKKLLDRDYKQELRDRVKDYNQGDYKRGSGYSNYQTNAIMKAAFKQDKDGNDLFDAKEKLMLGLLVHGTMRNDEAQQTSLDCFNKEKGQLEMIKSGMTKQNRGRVVHDVRPVVFNLAEQVKKEEKLSPEENIFKGYDDHKVRDLMKRACREAHVKYSGVHDARKAFVEREEKRLFKGVLKGEITKSDLAEKIMQQVSVKESLNPMVKKVKHYIYKTDKDGKRKRIPVYDRDADRSIIREPKFSMEKLMDMKVEDLVDLHMSQQLGHSDPDTTNEYRLEQAKTNRKNFRDKCRQSRKKGEIE